MNTIHLGAFFIRSSTFYKKKKKIVKAELLLSVGLILVTPPASFLQGFRQFIFSQRSQVTMFVNLGLWLPVDSFLILMKS